jgi:outer membrane protein TolC
VRVSQAREAFDAWHNEIMPSLEIELRQAESAYKAGEVALLSVLDVGRRLVDGRMRQLDAEADLFRSRIALERAIGRDCRAR